MGEEKGRKLTKNERKRLKKKTQKKEVVEEEKVKMEDEPPMPEGEEAAPPPPEPEEENVTIEYVSASLDDPSLDQFKDIFAKFSTPEELTAQPAKGGAKVETKPNDAAAPPPPPPEEEENEDGEPKLSRKQRKKLHRLSVAELKQLVVRPDVVEAHDVTAADPRLLVYLKSYRNTVPVPRHWCHKRKYLQGKRGIEKAPFQLPDFIAHTGIEKIRSAIIEQEVEASAKQKGRGRVAPKMGKIDIDYQVLHDAFFKYQKKPRLSTFGDIYYEGKEFEVKLREKKPGILSGALKQALGMPEGAPPPWLINMQRYGPPPSYPNLKIPGLNAPIPDGAEFGYHPGGWGKPPVDELNRPLYGDVFGKASKNLEEEVAVNRTLWGELMSGDEESSEEEEEEEEEQDGGAMDMELETTDVSGLDTPATQTGISSVTTGLETPESIDLRKRRGTETPETSGIDSAPRELYQVVQEKISKVGGGQIFGTDKKYVLPTGDQAGGDVAVALNPDQLETQVENEAFLQQTFNEGQEDLLEEQRKRKRKAEKDRDAKKKKNDGFKF